MSVSAPFFTPSEHVVAPHRSGDPEQMPLWQSEAFEHSLPAPHLVQLAPPQSTSVSAPFFTPSEHVAV
jgi:hypothetical protein